MSQEQGKIIGALIAGTAIGIAIGLLMAPEKGEVSRQKIADKLKEWEEDILQEIKNIREQNHPTEPHQQV